jgi:colanic acid/amylovoran biosynthesis glycosyltransferase
MSPAARQPAFAYLFERFPSFTQTFCFREAVEMARQQMAPAIYSIRPQDENSPALPNELKVDYLPPDEELTSQVKRQRAEKKIPRAMNRTLAEWEGKLDKHRVYAAAWLGPELKRRGIRHVHAHFAGVAARTAYWLKRFYGISYSFTGHANDIFCETNLPVTLLNLVRDAEFVATETEFSRNWMAGKFPQFAGKMHRVYNGIEANKFPVADFAREKPRIISVGRLIEKKGFGDLITACGLMRDRGIDFDCEIIGEGPLHEELQQLIQRLSLAANVRLAGARSQAELIYMFAEATMFVLPCVQERGGGMDNLPTVIMEAMAAGLPVISTPVAGVPEMVIPGETGDLVPEKAPSELAAVMMKLAQNRTLAKEFGRRGRELAMRKFELSETTRGLKHLLVATGRVSPGKQAMAHDPQLREIKPSWFRRVCRRFRV